EATADRDTTAHDHDLGTAQGYVVAAQQLDDPARGTRQRRLLHQDELAQVDRLETVGVLDRVDQSQDTPLVHPLRQGKLHDVTGTVRVVVEFANGQIGRAHV